MMEKSIAVILPKGPLLGWHRCFKDKLQERVSDKLLFSTYHELSVRSALLSSWQTVEQRLKKRSYPLLEVEDSTSDLCPLNLNNNMGIAQADVVINLSEAPTPYQPQKGQRVLYPLFHGAHSCEGITEAMVKGSPPVLSLWDHRFGQRAKMLLDSVLAIESSHLWLATQQMVYARLLSLLDSAVEHLVSGRPIRNLQHPEQEHDGKISTVPFLIYIAKRRMINMKNKFFRKILRWHLAWAEKKKPIPAIEQWDELQFKEICLPKHSSYADPHLLAHEGQTYLFCEAIPNNTRKGIISVLEYNEKNQSWQGPKVIIETLYHLSYPYVFAHAGEFYMIPETVKNKTIELYRAERFPDVWQHEAILLSDIQALDATPWYDGKNWWLWASVVTPYSSGWDELALFYATDLTGPWHSHALNPIKSNACSARPAGALFQLQNILCRPAQRCHPHYGAGIDIYTIKSLSSMEFQEEKMTSLPLPQGLKTQSMHTLTETDHLVVIDIQ